MKPNRQQIWPSWRAPLAAAAKGLLAAALLATLSQAQAQRLFLEDFEGLNLGPNVEEALAGAKVWTKTAPAGWTIDDSKVPGVGDATKNGVTEWAGWSFANKDWWVRTAGDQRRSEFSFGRGTVMIADPDEWDDAAHTQGLLETTITTRAIGVTNAAANSLVLVYDSSWRPEATDDGLPNFPVAEDGSRINNQTGVISAAYDSAAMAEIQRWSSISDDPNYHDHFPNESVVIPLNNPAGAKNLVLKFGMEKAANDWWWALDNIAVGVPPFATGIAADGVSFTVRIVEALGKSVDTAKGVTVTLDGAKVTPVEVVKEGDYQMVKYTQAPTVFQPGTKHTVKVAYTSNEGKALEDTTEFIAPSYTTATATPQSVTATITDTDYLAVDEAKGVQLELDGAKVTATSVSRLDKVVTVVYKQTAVFASDSAHTLKVSFTTVAGKPVADPVTFTAPHYEVVPATLATAAGTGAQAGLRWRTHQTATARGATVAEAESQLRGTLGADLHDPSGAGPGGYFAIDYVNFEQAAGEAGNFKSSADAPQNVDDLLIPGIPGLEGGSDYMAGEALAFVEFPQAGLYTMVVNSDDGFQLSIGTTNSPTQLVLGKFDAGRGAADSQIYFQVTQPGVYFVRLLWFEGTGGASVEWFSVNADGSKALVGGSQPGALKAYRVRTVPEPATGGSGKITSVALTGGKVVITYTGTLKSSATVNGTFAPVTGASSPYSVTPSESKLFFIAQ